MYSTVVYSQSLLPAPHLTTNESNVLKSVHPYLPDTPLPLPKIVVLSPKTLSLREAIMLTLRNNPEVKSSEIQRVIDKYQVILAKWVFKPKYKFDFTSTLEHTMRPVYSFTPGINLLTHSGSQFGINYANDFNGSGGATTFSWTQPLIKGAGAVNTVPLYDALTNEKIAKLTFKNRIIGSVDGVIIAYRQLVQDYNNLDIQKRFLKESAEALRQYELRVKVGKMAPSDILQQKANYETTKLALVRQENELQQNYQNFLSAIGLLPTSQLNIVKKITIQHYPLPTKQEAIRHALQGNIAYRQALLQLQNTRRAIITARNERRWTFDVTASETIGSADKVVPGLPANSGFLNTVTRGPLLTVNLQIPIDNVPGKADEISARVQLEQAKLALEQQKQDLVRQVMTQLQTIRNDWQQIQVSRSAVAAQTATLKAARLKLYYGRSTVFEVTRDQDALLQQETSLVATEITYLNDITGLETIWGETLHVWGIQLRY